MEREIKPKDVEGLIRTGKLRVGDELEFCDTSDGYGYWIRHKFNGVVSTETICGNRLVFAAEVCPMMDNWLYCRARFPQ